MAAVFLFLFLALLLVASVLTFLEALGRSGVGPQCGAGGYHPPMSGGDGGGYCGYGDGGHAGGDGGCGDGGCG